jgi:hypothetical protein
MTPAAIRELAVTSRHTRASEHPNDEEDLLTGEENPCGLEGENCEDEDNEGCSSEAREPEEVGREEDTDQSRGQAQGASGYTQVVRLAWSASRLF